MRVEFEYQTTDTDTDEEVLLTVSAEVDLGRPAILDRRPEHCEPGESASAEIDEVIDPDGETVTREHLRSRYGTTHLALRAEAIAVARNTRRY